MFGRCLGGEALEILCVTEYFVASIGVARFFCGGGGVGLCRALMVPPFFHMQHDKSSSQFQIKSYWALCSGKQTRTQQIGWARENAAPLKFNPKTGFSACFRASINADRGQLKT